MEAGQQFGRACMCALIRIDPDLQLVLRPLQPTSAVHLRNHVSQTNMPGVLLQRDHWRQQHSVLTLCAVSHGVVVIFHHSCAFSCATLCTHLFFTDQTSHVGLTLDRSMSSRLLHPDRWEARKSVTVSMPCSTRTPTMMPGARSC